MHELKEQTKISEHARADSRSLGHVESFDWLISIPFHNFLVVAWQHGCVQSHPFVYGFVLQKSENRDQWQ